MNTLIRVKLGIACFKTLFVSHVLSKGCLSSAEKRCGNSPIPVRSVSEPSVHPFLLARRLQRACRIQES